MENQTDVKALVKAFFEPVLSMAVKNAKDGEEEKDKKEEKIENEDVDKRELIDKVGGILKGKVDDEIIRTVIGLVEKASYNKSETGGADNGKKVKNDDDDTPKEDEIKNKKVKNNDDEDDEGKVKELEDDVKKDVTNKCKNSKGDYNLTNQVFNSSTSAPDAKRYVSREERLKAAHEYFKRA